MLKLQQTELKAELQTLKEVQPHLEHLVSIEKELTMLVRRAEETRKNNEIKALEDKHKAQESRLFYMLQIASLKS